MRYTGSARGSLYVVLRRSSFFVLYSFKNSRASKTRMSEAAQQYTTRNFEKAYMKNVYEHILLLDILFNNRYFNENITVDIDS